MLKAEFLSALRARLPGMPKKKLDALVARYDSEIDERIKTTYDEEKAVAYMGDIEKIAEEQTEKTSLFGLLTEKIRPKKKIKGWKIALVVFLSLLWILTGVLVFALSLICLLVVWLPSILTISAVCVLLFDAALSCYTGIGHYSSDKTMQAVFFYASAAFLLGAAILAAILAVRAVRADIRWTGKIVRKVKAALIKRGKTQ